MANELHCDQHGAKGGSCDLKPRHFSALYRPDVPWLLWAHLCHLNGGMEIRSRREEGKESILSGTALRYL